MPELRDALEAAGFDDVRTYVQSGNVVLSSRKKPESVERDCRRVLADRLGLELDVVVRTRDELADVVERNPFARVAKNPKRYQVTFLASELDAAVIEKVEAAAVKPERVVVDGREVYAWHPETIARSKLWTLLAGPKLGVPATARNWTTVTKLLELANESEGT
jgi:uncharacterized protein (DUF1697 family)